ncbi:zwei Ig domain protein zig-8-like [Eriocheir sinensis]|uniref:zwei Ig domain protein zig-8-like n=1 Tax=Eriocheir sinensis TaxID=95602 RepID=UPI0021CAB155|nr:zwei Ig domain protein zig-8-like [Eriocheir sinensis]
MAVPRLPAPLILLLWAVRASDGQADNRTEGTILETSPFPSQAQQMLDMSYTPEPLEAHKESFPGRVSATDPYIDPATATKVRAYAGTTAFIPCIVNNLGQRSVSWVRHHDIHVLTVGRFTFTNDDRFEVHHDDGSNEWLLRLRSPTTNDSGTYECQINTKPTITQLINLVVLEPRAVITAGSELYLDRGSTLRLTCQVRDAPSPSEFLLWYHEQKQVANYEVEKVEVSVGADDNGTTVSTLTLEDAQVHNSGLYTCSPSNAKPSSIRVHVLSGEHPAAMQTNSSPCLMCPRSSSSSSSFLYWRGNLSSSLLPFFMLLLALLASPFRPLQQALLLALLVSSAALQQAS